MPNPQSNPTAVSISSQHWQSESSHATNANGSPSPEPKDLTLTVDPEALFYETEESPATLLAASAKTIQAIATATGPGASSATVTLTCPDGSFTGTGFASHVYSVTEADSGKEIQFFAAATERPKKKAKVPVFMIKTMTLAKFPKDKKRKTIGVSEEVDVTLSPEIGSISWTIEGEGKLTGAGFTTTFRADDVAGKPKVKATVTTASGEAIDSKVAFNVIAPNGIQDIQHPDKSEFHIKGVPSAGFCARVFILPNTVSFMNIKVWEGECTYSADGYWIDLNGQKIKKGQKYQ